MSYGLTKTHGYNLSLKPMRMSSISINADYTSMGDCLDMPSENKPKWKHDCQTCVFLGQTIGGGRLSDLYFHPNSALDVTLIARYGDKGPDYYSMDIGYAKPTGHAELWAAAALYARIKGENTISVQDKWS